VRNHYRASVARHLRLGEVLLALEGMAIARGVYTGDDADVQARVVDTGEILVGLEADDPSTLEQLGVDVTECDPRSGYGKWSSTYDDGINPLIDLEEPALLAVLDTIEAGTAVDMGCGTGRVLGLLNRRGHTVTGIDQSPEMLTLAAVRLPTATLISATLAGPGSIPVPSNTVDLVTCALTMAHLPSLDEPVEELARLLRPGGRLVITDAHPLAVLFDLQAVFNADDEHTSWVRNHVHLHSDYLRAFESAGLRVRACVEPVVTPGRGPLLSLAAQVRPHAAHAAYIGLPYVLIWDLERCP